MAFAKTKKRKEKKWLPWHVVATLVCGSVMRTSLIVLKNVTCEWTVVSISPSLMWDSERSINAPGILNNFPHNLTHKHKHNRLTSYKRERDTLVNNGANDKMKEHLITVISLNWLKKTTQEISLSLSRLVTEMICLVANY